jgi:hypothetical protein
MNVAHAALILLSALVVGCAPDEQLVREQREPSMRVRMACVVAGNPKVLWRGTIVLDAGESVDVFDDSVKSLESGFVLDPPNALVFAVWSESATTSTAAAGREP